MLHIKGAQVGARKANYELTAVTYWRLSGSGCLISVVFCIFIFRKRAINDLKGPFLSSVFGLWGDTKKGISYVQKEISRKRLSFSFFKLALFSLFRCPLLTLFLWFFFYISYFRFRFLLFFVFLTNCTSSVLGTSSYSELATMYVNTDFTWVTARFPLIMKTSSWTKMSIFYSQELRRLLSLKNCFLKSFWVPFQKTKSCFDKWVGEV